jgi:hypothetical protein
MNHVIETNNQKFHMNRYFYENYLRFCYYALFTCKNPYKNKKLPDNTLLFIKLKDSYMNECGEEIKQILTITQRKPGGIKFFKYLKN